MNDNKYKKKHGLVTRLIEAWLVWRFHRINRRKPWYELPKLSGLLNLIALRIELRANNLHDTDGDLTKPKPGCPFHAMPEGRMMRTESGTQNDLRYPAMGCRFSRLGRNVPRELTAPDQARLMQPNPLLVSQQLLARKEFKPAESLNLLAAAWIQFQVHDWFGHENEDINAGKDHVVPQAGDWTDPVMTIPKTQPDPDKLTPEDSKYPAYRSRNPQWWDGSQVYGESKDETLELRTDPGTNKLCPTGHLYLTADGLLDVDPKTGQVHSGFIDNWWLGLEILHTLFAKEHNSICDHLKASEPKLSDEEIFEKARLVNCAVMAKIHTVEWTPGILGHPVIQPALDANWMGMIGHWFGEGAARRMAEFLPQGEIREILTGIPLTEPDHHGAPYALTEEFTAVYRLHPLIPDKVQIRSHATGALGKSYDMIEIAFTKARTPISDASMEDAIYSFGTAHPGAITINNHPNFLRRLTVPVNDAGVQQAPLDLAAVDILRDRERGVPRFNDFRRSLHKPAVKDWLDLAGGNAELAKTLETVYEGRLEDVDTQVGMLCEPLPKGFGFSDTAFRVFILMASRRLKSDRFFTTDYRPEVYTQAGLDWIGATGIREVILRHHPDLKRAFIPGKNPFAPWKDLQANLP